MSAGFLLIVVLAGVFLVLLFRVRLWIRENSFRKNGKTVVGTVTYAGKSANFNSYKGIIRVYAIRARYKYGEYGYETPTRHCFTEPPFQEGDSIIVHVRKDKPSESMILPESTFCI